MIKILSSFAISFYDYLFDKDFTIYYYRSIFGAIKKRGNIPYCSISEARPKADVNKQKECPRNRRHFHFHFPCNIEKLVVFQKLGNCKAKRYMLFYNMF